MSEPLAHSGGHLLAEHLQTVAVIAGRFARAWRSAFGFAVQALRRLPSGVGALGWRIWV